MEQQRNLYHYTNIDTLALILKNKTIKFNSLNNVDDLEEAQTKDLGRYGKYCFISCWTEESEESIPFWHMYTKEMKGVRIKLPSDMFIKHMVNAVGSDKSFESHFKLEELSTNKYCINPPYYGILYKVDYTNDEELIYPTIRKITEGGESFNFGTLGICKRKIWSFQKEWRFMFRVTNISLEEMQNMDFRRFYRELETDADFCMDSYFLKLDDQAFEKMEITLGPNISEGEKIIVEALVNEFNPKAKVFMSSLSKKVRPK